MTDTNNNGHHKPAGSALVVCESQQAMSTGVSGGKCFHTKLGRQTECRGEGAR